MYLPATYGAALLMMILSMVCWGSWANTQKLPKNWRFELFYWDYVWGILLTAVILGYTLGSTNPKSPESFMANLGQADAHHLLLAFAGGVVFNVANILLVAAIAIAGMAVAFPIGIGLALVIGSVLNYLITPAGNPLLLFAGVSLVSVAIVLDALAYRKITPDTKLSAKGILLSLLSGVGIGVFYPFVAAAMKGEHPLGPYAVAYVFGIGVLACTFPLNSLLMRRPILGAPVSVMDYLKGSKSAHFWGVLGGVIWGVGTISSFVASDVQMVGPAASYALGQGATMVSALWGIFVWKEFGGASKSVKRLLVTMFAVFLLGLASVALAPVIK